MRMAHVYGLSSVVWEVANNGKEKYLKGYFCNVRVSEFFCNQTSHICLLFVFPFLLGCHVNAEFFVALIRQFHKSTRTTNVLVSGYF